MTLDITVGTSAEFKNAHDNRAMIVKEHILNFFDNEEEFKDELRHIMRAFGVNSYLAMDIAIDGGLFLIYNSDIRKFLENKIGVIVSDDMDLFDTYKANLCYFGAIML